MVTHSPKSKKAFKLTLLIFCFYALSLSGCQKDTPSIEPQVGAIDPGPLPCKAEVISVTCLGAEWNSFKDKIVRMPDDIVSVTVTDNKSEIFKIVRPSTFITIEVTVQNAQIINISIAKSKYDKNNKSREFRKPSYEFIEYTKTTYPNLSWNKSNQPLEIDNEKYKITIFQDRSAINYYLKM